MFVDEFVFKFVSEDAAKVKKDLAEIQALAKNEALKSKQRHVGERQEIDKDVKAREHAAKEFEKAAKAREAADKKAAATAAKALRERERAERAASRASKEMIEGIFGPLGKLDGLFTSIAQKVGIGVTAAFGAAGAALKDLTHDADQIKTMATYTALSTTRFQELAYATSTAGVSGEKLGDGFRELANNLRESALGGGKGSAADSIRALGLNFKEILRLAPDQQLLKIGDAAKKMGPSLARSSVLARLFGETAGAGLGRVFDMGSTEIERLTRRAHELGGVIEGDLFDKAVQAENSWLDFKTALNGVRNAIGAELIPVVTEYAGLLTDWLAQNRQLIGQRVREWLKALVDAGRPMIPWIREAVSHFGDFIKIVKEFGPTLIAAAAATKGLMVTKEAISVLGGLGTAFKTAAVEATAFKSAVGGILAVFIELLPWAMKFGDFLGDMGNQNTGPIPLAKRITSADITAQRTIVGGEGYAARIARMNEAEVADLKEQIAQTQRGKDVRTSGIYEALFHRAEQIRQGPGVSEDDKTALAEAVAQGLDQYSKKDLRGLLKLGLISKEQYQADLLRRKDIAKAYTPRETDKKVTTEELMKLIDQAVQNNKGDTLDSLLRGRKLEGGSPPIITVQMWNFKVDAPITIETKEGMSAGDVAVSTKDQFDNHLGRHIQKWTTRSRVQR